MIGDRLASEHAVGPRPHIAEAADEPTGVLDTVAGHDLVVVPDGGTGLEVLSRAATSVLIARAATSPTPFPESILVAVDGTAEAHAAARLGAALSVRHDTSVALVATPEHDATHQHALQHHIETVERITGERPLVLDEHRGPVPSILAAAAERRGVLDRDGPQAGRPRPQRVGAGRRRGDVLRAGRPPGCLSAQLAAARSGSRLRRARAGNPAADRRTELGL